MADGKSNGKPRTKPERVKGPRSLVIVDPETRRKFLDAVRGGAPLTHAAVYAGWNDRTMFRAWSRGHDVQAALEAGEPINSDDQAYYDFMMETKAARSTVAVRNIALMQKAAQGGYLVRERTLPNGTVEREYAPVEWRAADRLLTTSFGNEFRESHRVELTGAGGGPVQIEGSESLQRLAASLHERLSADPDDDVLDGEVVGEIEA